MSRRVTEKLLDKDRLTVDDVARMANIRTEDAQALFEAIRTALDNGQQVHIQTFGTFRASILPPRTVHYHGKPQEVGPRIVPRFTRSRKLSDYLNREQD